jgi:diguanylate cyclase (GGDEF)-like protein
MGIRLKLILLLTCLLVPLLGAGGLLNVAIMEDTLLEETRHRGLTLLSALSVPCSIALANHEIERLDDYLAQLSGRKKAASTDPGTDATGDPIRDLVYLCVVDQDGRVLAHTRETDYGSVRKDPFARRAINADTPQYEDGETTLAVSLPVKSGLRWGTLLAEFSLQRLQARTAKMRRHTIAITMALILLAVAALSLGLARLVVRPVKSLSAMAERLGAGDLDHRVSIESTDELGRLGTVFNQTAEELAGYTRDLERKVRERQQEIVEKNEELEEEKVRLSEANRRLEEVATTDGLTNIPNKTHWLSRLEFEVLRAKRGKHRLSMLMLDVDHFKHYNDSQGHLAGDRLLTDLAALLTRNLRATDIPGRFGGEEFCVALLDTNRRAGARVAEKIRRAILKDEFPGQETQPGGSLTVSIGVAELDPEKDTPNDLIEKADRALYQAKDEGRNKVVVG